MPAKKIKTKKQKASGKKTISSNKSPKDLKEEDVFPSVSSVDDSIVADVPPSDGDQLEVGHNDDVMDVEPLDVIEGKADSNSTVNHKVDHSIQKTNSVKDDVPNIDKFVNRIKELTLDNLINFGRANVSDSSFVHRGFHDLDANEVRMEPDLLSRDQEITHLGRVFDVTEKSLESKECALTLNVHNPSVDSPIVRHPDFGNSSTDAVTAHMIYGRENVKHSKTDDSVEVKDLPRPYRRFPYPALGKCNATNLLDTRGVVFESSIFDNGKYVYPKISNGLSGLFEFFFKDNRNVPFESQFVDDSKGDSNHISEFMNTFLNGGNVRFEYQDNNKYFLLCRHIIFRYFFVGYRVVDCLRSSTIPILNLWVGILRSQSMVIPKTGAFYNLIEKLNAYISALSGGARKCDVELHNLLNECMNPFVDNQNLAQPALSTRRNEVKKAGQSTRFLLSVLHDPYDTNAGYSNHLLSYWSLGGRTSKRFNVFIRNMKTNSLSIPFFNHIPDVSANQKNLWAFFGEVRRYYDININGKKQRGNVSYDNNFEKLLLTHDNGNSGALKGMIYLVDFWRSKNFDFHAGIPYCFSRGYDVAGDSNSNVTIFRDNTLWAILGSRTLITSDQFTHLTDPDPLFSRVLAIEARNKMSLSMVNFSSVMEYAFCYCLRQSVIPGWDVVAKDILINTSPDRDFVINLGPGNLFPNECSQGTYNDKLYNIGRFVFDYFGMFSEVVSHSMRLYRPYVVGHDINLHSDFKYEGKDVFDSLSQEWFNDYLNYYKNIIKSVSKGEPAFGFDLSTRSVVRTIVLCRNAVGADDMDKYCHLNTPSGMQWHCKMSRNVISSKLNSDMLLKCFSVNEPPPYITVGDVLDRCGVAVNLIGKVKYSYLSDADCLKHNRAIKIHILRKKWHILCMIQTFFHREA